MLGLPSLPVVAAAAFLLFATGAAIGAKLGHDQGYRSGYADGYRTGVAAMAAEVERRNAAAGEAARRARGNVDACWDGGRSWDQTQGRCRD